MTAASQAEAAERWSVFLSVDWVDEENPDPMDEADRVDEAVVSLVRAVLAQGGTIAMPEHEAFTPLVAFIASEHVQPARVERSRDERPWLPLEVHACRDSRLRRVRASELPAAPDAPRIHELPLGEFIEERRPRGMVCIGGGALMHEHYALFRRTYPNAPIYVLTTTGGTAAVLARRGDNYLRAIDEDVLWRLEWTAPDEPPPLWEEEPVPWFFQEAEPELIPYPLILQEVAASLGRESPGSEPTPSPLVPRPGGSGGAVPVGA
jgi:hypothetical protein